MERNKFVVDTMLGKLARWLRILGYDTIYDPKLTDNELFFKAHLEKRILLTRDHELASRMNPNFCMYIEENETKNQIIQVIRNFKLNSKEGIFTRCILCNEVVIPIEKSKVQQKIPRYIYQTVDDFSYCEVCKKVYWPGSHIKSVEKILEELNETIDS